jgi:hypothetical protein
MDSAWFGFLVIIVPIHILLIAIPTTRTLGAKISPLSKLLWCGFLLLAPLVGAAIFHYKFGTSLFHGRAYEISAAEERARSGTLAPSDDDK